LQVGLAVGHPFRLVDDDEVAGQLVSGQVGSSVGLPEPICDVAAVEGGETSSSQTDALADQKDLVYGITVYHAAAKETR
jgi:hypothetical protein